MTRLLSHVGCVARHLPCFCQVTGIRQYKGFGVRHPFFQSGLLLRLSRLSLHSRLVPFQKGNVVSLDNEVWHFKFALRGSLKGAIRFFYAPKRNLAVGEKQVSDGKVRISLDGQFGFAPRLLIFAEDRINKSCQESVGFPSTRVSLHP